MTTLPYLQLQPIDPQDDGTTSPLDDYQQDETIDLNEEIDETTFEQKWDAIETDLHKADATTSK